MKNKNIHITNFLGMNTAKLPHKLEPNEMALTMNLLLQRDGTYSQRGGSQYVTEMAAPIHIFSFPMIYNGVVTDLLVCISGVSVSIYNGVSFTSCGTVTAGEVWAGVAYVDKFIFSNGVYTYVLSYNGSNYQVDVISYTYKTTGSSQVVNIAIGDIVLVSSTSIYYVALTARTSIDLNTEDFSNITNWHNIGVDSVVPACSLYAIFDNRVFCCDDGSENLYWSGNADVTSWDALDFIALGSKPTALFALGEFLFVGTEDGLYSITLTGDATAPYRVVNLFRGGVLKAGIVECMHGIIGCFTNQGFVIFDQYAQKGSQVMQNYGDQVINILQDIGNYTNTAVKYKDHIFYSFYADNPELFTPNTSHQNNAQLVLLPSNSESGISTAWGFTNLPMFTTAVLNNELYYTDYSNRLFKITNGVYQDNSAEFDTYLVTGVIDIDTPEFTKNYRRLYLVVNSETMTTIKAYWDVAYSLLYPYNAENTSYASGGVWGSSAWGEFIWGGAYAQMPEYRIDSTGKGLRIKIARASNNTDLKIQDIIVEWYPAATI